jgi:hypothetical protein
MRIEMMKTYNSGIKKSGSRHSRGFTLVASLLMLVLLSGIAIGLMMMVNTEGKVGNTDLQNNLAFHAAEGGMEKMYSDLSAVFHNIQSPQATDICGVGSVANEPSIIGVTWTQYSVMPGTTQQTTCPSTLTSVWGQISGSGPDAGLWAQVMPVNMLVTAAFPGGQEVSMTRTAQVALIPVFQFGVFCEGDCGFFDSPNLTFAGRVHTNSDLYLGVSGGSTLVFNNKLEAYGNVITENLPNGLSSTGSNWDDTGNVYLPTQSNGCSNPGTVTTDCILKAANSAPSGSPWGDGSLKGAGGDPPQSAYNTTYWNTFSTSAASGTNKMLVNGNYGSLVTPGTGAKKLTMPFVAPGVLPNELIRRARSTDTAALTQSREENLAQIHVLLSDDPAELPSGAVRLANTISTENGGASNPFGIATSYPTGTNTYFPTRLATPSGSNTYNMYFAAASNGYIPDPTSCAGAACPTTKCAGGVTCSVQYLAPDWLFAPQAPPSGYQTLQPSTSPAAPLEVVGTTNSPTNPYPTFALCSTIGGSMPTGCSGTTAIAYPYYAVQNQNNSAVWNLIDGYLYVEYEDASGTWHNVTNEWLQLGFARGLAAPSAPGTNPINPNAILLLQQPADRNGNSSFSNPPVPPDPTGIAPSCSRWNSGHTACTGTWSNPLTPEVIPDAASNSPYFGYGTATVPGSGNLFTPTGQSVSMFNWYPINFYDAREGEVRANDWGNNSCTTNGLLNAVEIDVGNLNRWLLGTIGSSGTSVNSTSQNGYVLYFSDRRGMLVNPDSGVGYKTGESGLEDVINANYSGDNAAGAPDGHLEPAPAGHTISPEDVNQNSILDMWGTVNLGLGQWVGTINNTTGLIGSATNQNVQIVAASPDNPFSPRMASCGVTGRKNWVSGARHVLKLVDGSLGSVPMSPTSTTVAGVVYHGGFTVASENPVYIQGNYNSSAADTFFTGASSTGAPGPDSTSPYHSAASIIADAVTILSNNWNDETSMVGINGNSDITYAPSGGPWAGNRLGATTYYRVAVAAGKNMAFTFPSWESGVDYGFGTDGGIHNFLRFLEDWDSPSSNPVLNYGGSLVSLYYSTYNTGVFKCCTYSVYAPPVRNYLFDVDFTNPAGLPPGTPMFRDVESLSYRQLFNARTATQ